MPLPKAILVDLDGTILDWGDPDEVWQDVCLEYAQRLRLDPQALCRAVIEARDWFWGDPHRHRQGRLGLRDARHEIVRTALERLKVADSPASTEMGDRYAALRERRVGLFAGAIDTLRRLRSEGVRLALVTNGAAEGQRAKIRRFNLTPLFDHIQIEGEFGEGKPDARVYLHALDQLGAQPSEAWMVGDDLEWEVAAPQRLGIFGIWFNPPSGSGLPGGSPVSVRPDRIIESLPELLEHQQSPPDDMPAEAE